MDLETRDALAAALIGIADDELLLGQRNAEWCGHAPILEEDIAFANIALDEIGHAGLWYGVLSDLLGENRDTYPDKLVYRRSPDEFRNIQLVEMPSRDWAFTIVRQFFFDAWELVQLEKLISSSFKPVAEVAAKVKNEEIYHLRHSEAWVRRLGLGTEKSNQRMQTAVDEIRKLSGQVGLKSENNHRLSEAGIMPRAEELWAEWMYRIVPVLDESGLKFPSTSDHIKIPRTVHSDHHEVLIFELQSVVRQHPRAIW